MDTLTAAEARRLALAAQGLLGAPGRPTRTQLHALLERLGAIQIDSINVVARSHELTLAARTIPAEGARPLTESFDDLVYRRRSGFEYWGHAASFLPMRHYRLFRPRMRRMAIETRGWFADLRSDHRGVYDEVLRRIEAEGPLAASDFRREDDEARGPWWDWAPAKRALEDLFDRGVLLVHDRVRFERRYDLADRILPPDVDRAPITAAEAAVSLTVLAARAMGVASPKDLADYFRLRPAEARVALSEALEAGLLVEVAVEGWRERAFVEPGVPIPARVTRPPVLLAPFDSLVWSRARTLRLFGFSYQLEVYVPPTRRMFGYYTMPVLAGGRLIGRVDPKHDRTRGLLVLRNVALERGVPSGAGLEAVAAAARRLALALGAAAVEVSAGSAEAFELRRLVDG